MKKRYKEMLEVAFLVIFASYCILFGQILGMNNNEFSLVTGVLLVGAVIAEIGLINTFIERGKHKDD